MENKVTVLEEELEELKNLAHIAKVYLKLDICPHCDKPMVHGYICSFCGKDPTDKIEEDGDSKSNV